MPDTTPGVPLLGIVIPAWNEGARISPTIEAIAALRATGWRISGVVVADDGSTDGTADVARVVAARLGLPLDVRSLPHGGKAWAVRDGMLHAARTLPVAYLLMLDADNEVSVDQLASVPWGNDPRTVYIARRVGETGGRSGVRPAPFRRLMSFGMRTLARLLLGLRYPDTQCGFKLFSAPLVPAIFGQMRSHSWVFDAELLVIARSLGLRVVEVPVVWQPRGVSRVPATAAFSSVAALVGIAARRARGLYGPPGARDADATATITRTAASVRRWGVTLWRPDLSRDAMLLIGFLAGLGQVAGLVSPPVDSLAYWAAGSSKLLYPEHWSQVANGLLFYPPPVAQLSTLLQPIGWAAFDVVWSGLIFGCFWYCAGRWSLPLVAVGLLPVIGVPVPVVGTFLGYALLGNMQWLLAALVIIALRHPSAWAAQVVTKTGPAVGALWLVFRGDWRAVFMAAGATVVVVAISFAFAPRMWAEWIGFVGRNYTLADPPLPLFPVPFGVRTLSAAALVAWGARTDHRWTVPIAAGWALPALYGFGFLPFWIGARRLVAQPRSTDELGLKGAETTNRVPF